MKNKEIYVQQILRESRAAHARSSLGGFGSLDKRGTEKFLNPGFGERSKAHVKKYSTSAIKLS